MNPFLSSGYAGEKYFCGRRTESDKILNAIENQKNIAIYSVKGMGRSSLINHVIHQLGASGKYHTLHLDISRSQTIEDLINIIGTAILSNYDQLPAVSRTKAESFIERAKPVVSYDPLTDQTSYAFYLDRPGEISWTLQELFAIINETGREARLVIAIDELTRILEYSDSLSSEALIRHINALDHVRFIFSGSKQQLFSALFADVPHPLINNTNTIVLREIPASTYSKFISSWFNKLNIDHTPDAIPLILDWTRRHTFYTQYVCRTIVANRTDYLDHDSLMWIFHQVLLEKEPHYLAYGKMLTRLQWKLLVALALEDGIARITTVRFMKKHGLSNASTVRRGVVALLDKGLIKRDKGRYFVDDLFFAHWLRWRQG